MPPTATASSDSGATPTPEHRLRFRLTLFVEGVEAEKGKAGYLRFPGGDQIRIQFRSRRKGDPKGTRHMRRPLCVGTAEMAYAVPKKAHQALVDGHVKIGFYGPDVEFWDWEAVPEGSRGSLQGVLKTVYSKLRDALQATYALLRWRQHLVGDAQPLSVGRLDCSLDGRSWREVPAEEAQWTWDIVWSVGSLRFSVTDAKDAAASLRAGTREPIAHELFREAWSQRTENARSALVVGMAAAEIGVKDFIARRIPAAGWLAIELPSPDLLKVLTKFVFPMLKQAPLCFDVSRGKDGYADPVLRDLQNGVTLRNDAAHRPGAAPEPKVVVKVLRSVRDLLYLLDYHAGHVWAVQHVRHDVREHWTPK